MATMTAAGLALAAALTALTALAGASARAQTAASLFGFTVEVTLSPKALAKMTASSESVTVSSFYHGQKARKPTRAEIRRAAADGEDPTSLELSGDEVTIPAAGGVAAMTGRSITPKDAAGWGKNVVNVNVNVYSGRRSAPDNLLDCDLFDDAVAVARAKPVVIACRLIGES